MQRAIEVHRLAKCYGKGLRRHEALLDVTVYVKSGELFGLVGPNGAGKTTLIKVLAGILSPDSGSAVVNGYDVSRKARLVKAATTLIKSGGWTGLLYHLSVVDNLRFFGKLAGLDSGVAERRVRKVVEQLELGDKANELPWYLSAGQRQKACLAMSAMIVTPVVLLDEPTAHLDPLAAQQVRYFIKEILNTQRGQTVLMSTHYLEEAEAMCDRIGILDRGRLIAVGTLDELRELSGVPVVLTIRAQVRKGEIVENLTAIDGASLAGVTMVDGVTGSYILRFVPAHGRSNPTAAVLSALRDIGVEVVWLRTEPPSLQDVFLRLTEDADA